MGSYRRLAVVHEPRQELGRLPPKRSGAPSSLLDPDTIQGEVTLLCRKPPETKSREQT